MRDFIILFDEKEGTSPLVRLLDNFDQISILHQVDSGGWEPFDRHNCGSMPLKNLEQCLGIVFDNKPVDMEYLNRIYTKTSSNPLEAISQNGVVGFKMRFRNPREIPRYTGFLPPWNRFWPKRFKANYASSFKSMMLDLLKRNNTTVFFAVRQDVLRWGLSKYHGDGTGMPGHLQFKLASGKINKENIGKIHVDCERLEEIIFECETLHAQKRQLMDELKIAGIRAHPLCYEDFLTDKHGYFKQVFEYLELDIPVDEIDAALSRGAYFGKVHADDISEFIVNSQEVIDQFGDRFVSWK